VCRRRGGSRADVSRATSVCRVGQWLSTRQRGPHGKAGGGGTGVSRPAGKIQSARQRVLCWRAARRVGRADGRRGCGEKRVRQAGQKSPTPERAAVDCPTGRFQVVGYDPDRSLPASQHRAGRLDAELHRVMADRVRCSKLCSNPRNDDGNRRQCAGSRMGSRLRSKYEAAAGAACRGHCRGYGDRFWRNEPEPSRTFYRRGRRDGHADFQSSVLSCTG